mmetsp:Transcript_1457/g.1993  ORF Transcript_1457/g.1993 Transcript_1457/m.1993 type:complete len:203 (-) Transcript_1457:171-779(-)
MQSTASKDNKRSNKLAKSNGTKPKKKQSRKNQIRNLKRLLHKKAFPEDKKIEIERKIQNLESQITENKAQDRIQKMQDKYKKVKFFEKVKVTRKLAQIEKKIKKCEDTSKSEELERQKSQLEDDLKYIEFYPADQKYIGLFANENDDSKTLKRKARMRELALQTAAYQTAGGNEHKTITSDEMEDMPDTELHNNPSDDFFLS